MKKKISGNAFDALSKIKKFITTRRALLVAAFAIFGLASAAIFWNQTSYAQRDTQKLDRSSEIQAENVWQTIEKRAVANLAEGLPADFQALRLDKQRLASLLSDAPHESRTPLRESSLVLQFPMPDGSFSRFRVQEAPVLEESLQARYPEIKSYRITAIDTAGTTGRFDLTPQGFHATILTPEKTIAVLPADKGDETLYAVYDGTSQLGESDFYCPVGEHSKEDLSKHKQHTSAAAPQASVGATLRTYRVAISATYEYSRDLGGGTLAGTIASINTWMNATNAIYERDLAIRLIVVDDTDVIFTNPADPYSDDDGVNGNEPVNNIAVLMTQVRRQLRDNVGVNNFNVGHLFARNQPGGAAGVGVVCHPASDADGPFKAAGVTGLTPAAGNLGALQVLAHEFGHQFNAPHNFNSKHPTCAGNTGANRSETGSFETGAGNTIMAYPNRCGDPNQNVGDNVVGFEYLRFHANNFEQINNHVINGTAAQGTVCFLPVNTGNTPPTVNAGANYTIPKLTPFTLTATGTDPDLGDQNNLTYTWEQYQAGGVNFFQNGTAASYSDLGDPINTTRPIFRAMPATINPSRTFPSLTYILNNQNDPPDQILNTPYGGLGWTAEELPRVSRSLVFRVTARDTIGGVSDSTMTATVDGNAGPFTVIDLTGNLTGGTSQTVSWNVANTGAGTTVNAANVRISLSTDGGQSFPMTLLPSTANDGSESITLPNISTNAARIKVEAVGNVFFDITGANFTITPGGICPIINDIAPKVAVVGSTIEITGTNFTGANSVAFNGLNATVFTVASDTKITATVPSGATGGRITVGKNGCSAAESANFTVCSGAVSETALDSGTQNFGAGGYENISYHVNRITPTSYPATLSEVRIYHSTWNTSPPVGKAITVLSAAHPSGSTNIDNTSFNTRAATVSAQGTFVTYPVEPITITQGDFIVGFRFANGVNSNPQDPNNPFYTNIAVSDVNQPMRSYGSGNGIAFQPSDIYSNTPDALMIRAAYYSGTCSTGTCSTTISIDDGTFEAFRGGTAGQTAYYINRLTPSSYPATLTGVRVYFLSGRGYNVGKAINILSAADQGGSNIDSVNFSTRADIITARDQYVTYPIAPITINSGDFLVGYSIVHETDGQGQLASVAEDLTPPIQGRSYMKDNGNLGYGLLTDTNHAIRAVLFDNTCQVGRCTYNITPTTQNFPLAGGSGTVTVTTQAGCPWTASRGSFWIGLTTNFNGLAVDNDVVSGAGSGSVTFTVAQNPSTARTGTITVAGQTFTVTQEAAPPTSAAVSVGGRVSTSDGIGIRGAIVSLADQNGQTRIARTNAFGYYRFDEVEAGETIVLSVTSKRYTFTPRGVTVNDSVEDLDFVSLE